VSDGWYYLSSEGHVGPLRLEKLKVILAAFRNGKEVLVWHEGFSGWERAQDVPELDVETLSPPPRTGIRRDGTANPKLPLSDTIRLSYSSYFHNFADVLRISWLWLAVALPLAGITNWLQFSRFAGVMAAINRGMAASKPVETIVLQSVANLVFIFAGVSIAVAWHRRLILEEHPGLSGSNVVTKSVWRYAWMGLAIFLIVIVPTMVLSLPMFLLSSPVATGSAPRFLMLIPVIFLLFLAAFAVALRLSLLLPARAVGDLDLTFKETWKRTRGNTWRLFWGTAACAWLPILAAQIVLIRFLPGISTVDRRGVRHSHGRRRHNSHRLPPAYSPNLDRLSVLLLLAFLRSDLNATFTAGSIGYGTRPSVPTGEESGGGAGVPAVHRLARSRAADPQECDGAVELSKVGAAAASTPSPACGGGLGRGQRPLLKRCG